MSEKDQGTIWVPRLAFVNALGPYQTTVDDLTTGVLIREDDPLAEDYSMAIEGWLGTHTEKVLRFLGVYFVRDLTG